MLHLNVIDIKGEIKKNVLKKQQLRKRQKTTKNSILQNIFKITLTK